MDSLPAKLVILFSDIREEKVYTPSEEQSQVKDCRVVVGRGCPLRERKPIIYVLLSQFYLLARVTSCQTQNSFAGFCKVVQNRCLGLE